MFSRQCAAAAESLTPELANERQTGHWLDTDDERYLVRTLACPVRIKEDADWILEHWGSGVTTCWEGASESGDGNWRGLGIRGCMHPFELQTEPGSTLTLSIRFQLSNVRPLILAVEDLLERWRSFACTW